MEKIGRTGFRLETNIKRRMEIPTALSKSEIDCAHVKPGQCPYEVALINHHRAEAGMRTERYKRVKEWKLRDAQEVKDERRAFLDTKKQEYLLDSSVTAFKLRNMTDSVLQVEAEEGPVAAKAFRRERYEYNRIMKLQENRFDFRQLQISYRDCRSELMSLTYEGLDTEMKKVKPIWSGYHELMDDTLDKAAQIAEKDRMIETLTENVRELTARIEALTENDEKAEKLFDSDDESDTSSIDDSSKVSKRKRMRMRKSV